MDGWMDGTQTTLNFLIRVAPYQAQTEIIMSAIKISSAAHRCTHSGDIRKTALNDPAKHSTQIPFKHIDILSTLIYSFIL